MRRQSRHLDDYRAALGRLEAMGLIYPCFCTRAEIGQSRAAARRKGRRARSIPAPAARFRPASGAARIAAGAAYALRLDVARALALTGPLTWEDEAAGTVAADPLALGDVVLARKDAPTSYHLAVTVDDAAQGVTLVTRGADLFASTHVHRLLQALLGLPVPRYCHHALVTDASGRRYAKRDRVGHAQRAARCGAHAR